MGPCRSHPGHTFSALSISAYVLSSYSKTGSQPNPWISMMTHSQRSVQWTSECNGTYQSLAALSQARSFPSSAPETRSAHVPVQRNMRRCIQQRRSCLGTRPACYSALRGRVHQGSVFWIGGTVCQQKTWKRLNGQVKVHIEDGTWKVRLIVRGGAVVQI